MCLHLVVAGRSRLGCNLGAPPAHAGFAGSQAPPAPAPTRPPPPAGAGDQPGSTLPPLTDPFWRRNDLAAQVVTVLNTLEKERALLMAQLASAKQAFTQKAETLGARLGPSRAPDRACFPGGSSSTREW